MAARSPSDAPKARKAPRVHCTNHCRSCGTHFSSTGAFDRHRTFAEGHKDDWDYRVCAEPADGDWFAPRTTDGLCDHDDIDAPHLGVTVWTRAKGLDANPWRRK